MPLAVYKKLLKGNITKRYKRTLAKLKASINFEVKYIASKLALSNRIERLAKTPAYITLKNNQENFHAITLNRLITSCKHVKTPAKSFLHSIN